MPRGNKSILLAALVQLWVLGVGFLLFWYVAMAGFDGYEVHLGRAVALYGSVGLVVAVVLYVGVGALLDRNR